MKTLFLLALLFVAGCNDSVVGVYDYMNLSTAVQFDSPQLHTLWNEVEQCSGLTGNINKVRFYRAVDGIQYHGTYVTGLYVRSTNQIFLAPAWWKNSIIIKHEEMHALLHGGPNHPAKYFNGVCGDLMTLRYE